MKSYLSYLRNVLGIRSVIMPAQGQVDSELITTVHRAKLVALDSGGWNKSEKVLLEKMIEALSKETESLEVVAYSGDLLSVLPTLIEAQEILLFDEDMQKTLSEKGISHAVLVHSPKILIAKPELKRDAWDVMKKAAQRVNASVRT